MGYLRNKNRLKKEKRKAMEKFYMHFFDCLELVSDCCASSVLSESGEGVDMIGICSNCQEWCGVVQDDSTDGIVGPAGYVDANGHWNKL